MSMGVAGDGMRTGESNACGLPSITEDTENFWGNLEFRYRYQFRDRVRTSGDSDRDRFDFFVLSFRLDYQLDTRRF